MQEKGNIEYREIYERSPRKFPAIFHFFTRMADWRKKHLQWAPGACHHKKETNNSVGDHSPHARADPTEEAKVVSEEVATSVQKYPFLFFHLLLLLDAWLILSMNFIMSCLSSVSYCFFCERVRRYSPRLVEMHALRVASVDGIATSSTTSTFEQLAPLPGTRFSCCRSWSTSWDASCCR